MPFGQGNERGTFFFSLSPSHQNLVRLRAHEIFIKLHVSLVRLILKASRSYVLLYYRCRNVATLR